MSKKNKNKKSQKKKEKKKKKQLDKVAKEIKRKKSKRQHPNPKKKKKKKKPTTTTTKTTSDWTSLYELAHGHFRHLPIKFLPCSFLSILERKHFGGPGKKTPRPHQFFSLRSLQPNTYKKSFPSHFLSKVFRLPYFTSKQTHP